MKNNRKGFTLIELLAVIIILGVLLLIAVPAVSKYIENSRKNTYINSINSIVSAISIAMNNLEYPLPKRGEAVIIPFEKVELEKGNANTRSPYAPYVEGKSYVLVTYEEGNYHYYVAALDEAGFAIPLIDVKKLNSSSITTDTNVISKNIYYYKDFFDSTNKFFVSDKFYRYVLGDVDNNGLVTKDDAAYIENHIENPKGYPANQNFDFNKDGKITKDDGVYVLMYTFFPGDFPIYP